MTARPLETYVKADAIRALKSGALVLELGPFSTRVKLSDRRSVAFFLDMYADCLVTLEDGALSDFSLTIRPPNQFRKYFRRQIVPDPGFGFPAAPLPVSMSPLALEMGLNLSVALQCFRYAIFHAGVVADGDQALIIAAKSGGGKSTLTAALMEEGWRLLSDEFAILDLEEASLRGYPRPVSLKNASIDVVRGFAGENQVSDTLYGTPKGSIAYRRPRRGDLERMALPARPRVIVFPAFTEGAAPRCQEIDLADTAMQLIASSPNYQVIGERAFTGLMTMLDGMKAYEIEYGSTEDSLALVSDLWRRHVS
ncbi:HprK-related kinase A [Kordiimonas lipolytica]|uniref:HprK-related kinase A n=1 Tax=Kordiimonas lipolytica TaxID=1662421 RepID=A0ABV8UER2_9PROT|nr:HprK-related kinase A [Kordiimonas lipolytica]